MIDSKISDPENVPDVPDSSVIPANLESVMTRRECLERFSSIAEPLRGNMIALLRRSKFPQYVDPEDLVQNAFLDFFEYLQRDPDAVLDHPGAILTVMVRRQYAEMLCADRSQKRGLGKVVSIEGCETDFHGMEQCQPWKQITSEGLRLNYDDSDPVSVAMMNDFMNAALKSQKSDDKSIIRLRQQGERNVEIAALLGTTDRKVRRHMERIRVVFEKLLELEAAA